MLTTKRSQEKSIRTSVYLPNEVHRRLKVMAAEQDTTTSWLICEALLNTYDQIDDGCVFGRPKTRSERREMREENKRKEKMNKKLKVLDVLTDDEFLENQARIDKRKED